jgi:hypothetical protein
LSLCSKISIWDPESEIWAEKKPIPDPGARKAPDPISGSATLLLSRATANRIEGDCCSTGSKKGYKDKSIDEGSTKGTRKEWRTREGTQENTKELDDHYEWTRIRIPFIIKRK